MVRGPVVRLCALCLAASICLGAAVTVRVTPVGVGPFRVAGNRLLDARGREFLIRGVDLPTFHPGVRTRDPYTSFSATTLSGVRRRWNFNAVRIPVDASAFDHNRDAWAQLARLLRQANQLELVAIVASDSDSATFWRECAGAIGGRTGVLLEAPGAVMPVLRAAGVGQPVITSGDTRDANALRDVHPAGDGLFDAGVRALAGEAAGAKPVIATGWDLPVQASGPVCDSLPRDPSGAEALVSDNLEFFDAHHISWIAPLFAPGALLGNYWSEDASTLENGWSCSAAAPGFANGIGEVVRFHLWGGAVRGLFVVNGGGGLLIPRGSIAIAYGPILADRDAHAPSSILPVRLAGVEIRVTDHLGVTRRARMQYASAGWGQANFIVPEECAPGPARIAVTRADGSQSTANAAIVDYEPSLWSAYGTGFGPAIAFAGDVKAFGCSRTECRAAPIRRSAGPVMVRLHGTGFRFAPAGSDVRVTIGGVAATVRAYRATSAPGIDELAVEAPASIRPGEWDVLCSFNGRLANVVRIAFAGAHN